MNTAQTTQEKRTIKVRAFLDDFRSGMNDQDLQAKYHLTQLGLEKFYGMLMDRGILSAGELQQSCRGQKPAAAGTTAVVPPSSAFLCPQCMASLETMTDTCPKCGVSFQQLVSTTPCAERKTAEKVAVKSEDQDDSLVPESLLNEIFASPQDRAKAAQNPPAADAEDEFCAHPRDKDSEFLNNDEFESFRVGFTDSPDDVVPGMPLDYVGSREGVFPKTEVHCESCNEVMQPRLRDVYDRQQSIIALIGAGISFLLGLLGSVTVTLFNGYSVGRLLAVYGTGLFLLAGAVLLTVGVFLYLAKERVFACPSCKRVYPRI